MELGDDLGLIGGGEFLDSAGRIVAVGSLRNPQNELGACAARALVEAVVAVDDLVASGTPREISKNACRVVRAARSARRRYRARVACGRGRETGALGDKIGTRSNGKPRTVEIGASELAIVLIYAVVKALIAGRDRGGREE